MILWGNADFAFLMKTQVTRNRVYFHTSQVSLIMLWQELRPKVTLHFSVTNIYILLYCNEFRALAIT